MYGWYVFESGHSSCRPTEEVCGYGPCTAPEQLCEVEQAGAVRAVCRASSSQSEMPVFRGENHGIVNFTAVPAPRR
jgi:hypothetical protein